MRNSPKTSIEKYQKAKNDLKEIEEVNNQRIEAIEEQLNEESSVSSAKISWKKYSNEKYKYELEFPDFFSDLKKGENNKINAEYRGDCAEDFILEIIENSLDGVKYEDLPGGFGYKFSSKEKDWLSLYGGELPEELKPKKYITKNNILSYHIQSADACGVWEEAWIEDVDSKYVIKIYTGRGCECDENLVPKTSRDTIIHILDTI